MYQQSYQSQNHEVCVFDYYRPYIPESVHEFSQINSYLYGHGCHTTLSVFLELSKNNTDTLVPVLANTFDGILIQP